MMLRFVSIVAGTLAVSAMAYGETLADGCATNDPRCVAAATAFLKKEAVKADERLRAIYRAYETILPKPERQGLKNDQATWLQTTSSDCGARTDTLDRWSCVGWSRNQRALELDRRLANALEHAGGKPPAPRFPIILTDQALGIEYGKPGLYVLNTDEFKLAQDADGTYAFSFGVVGGNGHVCSAAGKAMHSGSEYTRIPDTQIDQNTFETAEGRQEQERLNVACKLDIRVFPNHVEFEGNDACHEYFLCGMRAAPAGTFFLKGGSAGTGSKKGGT
jgi:uncharacterized protein YecT (DUF1311 family)